MSAVGVRVLAAFLLGGCLLGCTFLRQGPCTLFGIEPCCVDVEFDLRQVLATVPGDVQVWACIDWKCVRHVVSSYSATFWVHQAAVDDPQVDMRVIVRDHGRVVFETTRLVRLHEWRPNGPGCTPAMFDGRVLATPEGDLILHYRDTELVHVF